MAVGIGNPFFPDFFFLRFLIENDNGGPLMNRRFWGLEIMPREINWSKKSVKKKKKKKKKKSGENRKI